MQETAKIWMNGELVDWADATVHVGVHGLHYGTGVFEGIRAYETAEGPGGLPARRPPAAAPRQRAPPVHGAALLGRGAARRRRTTSCARTGCPPCYLRPIAFYGYGSLGVHTQRQPGRDGDHELAVGRVPRRGRAREGHHREDLVLEARRPEHRSRTSRRRPAIYLNSMLATTEAQRAGYDEGILLTRQRLRRRRAGREHLRRQGRPDPDAAALDVDPPGHHARLASSRSRRISATSSRRPT